MALKDALRLLKPIGEPRMSLREDIWDKLPPHVTDVKVGRSNIKGVDAINVKVTYLDPAHRTWIMDINFAEKNKMTAEEMAANIKSRMHFEAVEDWENEGGNGTVRN